VSFGRLKTRVRALINRKDFTDQLAGEFILDAISDLERDLRIGPMERIFEQSATWDGVKNALAIPAKYLELINLFTDSGELEQVDLDKWMSIKDVGGVPTHFVKIADRFLLRPTPAVGTKVYLHYYGETVRPQDDADEVIWTQSAFLAALYTTAALAADFYQMEGDQHADRYRALAQGYVEKIAGQDLNEKWAGRLSIPAPLHVGEY
jgi:hypothetical protein